MAASPGVGEAAIPRVGDGIATSRTWGHGGGVVWSPGQVRAEIYVPFQPPSERTMNVTYRTVDDAGRLKTRSISIPVTGEMRGREIKDLLIETGKMPNAGPPLTKERMKLVVYGSDLADDQPLNSLAPTAPEVQARLQIRRAGTAMLPCHVGSSDHDGTSAQTPNTPLTPRLPSSPRTSSPAAIALAAKASALAAPKAGGAVPTTSPPYSLMLRCSLSSAGAVHIRGLSGDMTVMALRVLVSAHPMAMQAWKSEASEVTEAKKPVAKDPKAANSDAGDT